jgi:hypothetical protein
MACTICLISLPAIISFGGTSKQKSALWKQNSAMPALWKQNSAIPENIVRKALGNLQARLEKRVCNDMQLLSDVLFKTI